jgi:adenylyltransferase/sulfurtransferase
MDSLSPAELARYSRHVLLPEIGQDGQRKLKHSRVLVVGAGGLGSPTALYLAAAGVGTLGIADFDQVEASNLHRQLLHSDSTVGQPKTVSAAGRLAETNPHTTVQQHPEGITAANAVDIFSSYDVVVDGTDNFASRYLHNDAASIAGVPLVFGSVYRFEGQVSVFAPHLGGPCYRCLFPEAPPAGSVPGCGEVGVIGALCGIVGSWQAMEAIKLLTGAGEPLIGKIMMIDTLSGQTSTMAVSPRQDCGCQATPQRSQILAQADYDRLIFPTPPPSATMSEYPLEIDVLTAKALLDDPNKTTRLIDVREPYETEICKVDCAQFIPMRQIPEHLPNLPRDVHLLIHCHHGGRSLRVVNYLREHGFTAVSNVGGGIQAWAEKIEPDMQRY